MIVTKRTLLWLFVLVETFVFIAVYLFGSHGMHKARVLTRELEQVNGQKEAVRAAIEDLSVTIHQWQTHDFHAEKLAREQLQMARPSEQLYVIMRQQPEENPVT